jgi:UDP-N-acetyl-D-galactosamine dehydrogenase
MGRWVARECVRRLCRRGCAVAGARVLILGGAFKEDVGDLRNSRVTDIVRELADYGAAPLICEPLAEDADVVHEIGGTPVPLAAVQDGSVGPVAAIILAVAHAPFRRLGPAALKGLVGTGPVLDVKGVIDRAVAQAEGLDLWRL